MAATSAAPLSAEYLAEDDSGKLIAVMWTATILPVIFVCLRVYARLVIRKTFGWDDGIAIAALACLIGYAAVVTAAARQGLGRHIEVVLATNPQHLIDIALLAQVSQTLAIMACTLGKTSFAVTLLRIVVQRRLIYILWFIIISMNLINVLCAIFVFVQCDDPRHLWNQAIPSKCWPTYVFTNFSLFVGAYSGAQDFVLALLPWFVILKLQMKTKEKIAVALAMSLGIFAGVTAVVKTTYLVNLSKKTDFTIALPPLLMWAAAEDGLALVAGSIPTLRPLYKAVFPGTSAGDSYKNVDSYQLRQPPINPPIFGVVKGQSHISAHQRGAEADDESDKSILDKSYSGLSLNNIKKTTDVNVSYAGSQ